MRKALVNLDMCVLFRGKAESWVGLNISEAGIRFGQDISKFQSSDTRALTDLIIGI